MRFMLLDVRIAFIDNLWTPGLPPNPQPGQEPKCSAAGIIKKDHKQVKDIRTAMAQLTNERWGAKGPAVLKALENTDKCFFRDGDTKPDWEGFEGNFYIKASNKVIPSVWDGQRNPLPKGGGGILYSGCDVNMSLEFKAYEIPGVGKGLNAVLRGVQYLRKNDAFSGVVLPADADEFDEISAPAEDDPLTA